MSTSGISQTGIDSSLTNQRMNALPQQPQSKPDKRKDNFTGDTDTVKITANLSAKPALEFEAIDEEKANILAQLVSSDLSKQSFGLSTQTGMEALRAFI